MVALRLLHFPAIRRIFLTHWYSEYRHCTMLLRLTILAAVLGTASSAFSAPAELSFNAQVRPLFSDRCLSCHGPDEKNRKAKLRLDTEQGGVFREKDGKFLVKPGAPDKSELYKRITSKDPDEKMPPPDSNLSLSESEIASIRQWIEQGAKWEKHWAFIPPRKVTPPDVKNASWPRNDIDRFILARLDKANLTPAMEASREKLLRRVSFDLTGLPPSMEELDAFVADSSENAYEKAVDRLLASKAYGERMTIDWLDLSRYSDTHGYQADRYRAMWPWRDWVIKSFNENMPYDQFVTWQLAGDLLPHPTKEQILATGFNRHHMQTEEGGSVEEEFRVSYVVDRVDTMGTAFLALTFECSRCHDHKFDPIAQRDFYSMFSFFNNIDESGQSSYFTDSMPVPTLLLSNDDQDRKLAELKSSIHQKESQAAALRQNAKGAFEAWLANRPKEPVLNGLVASLSFEEIKDNKVANAANASKPAAASESPQLVEGYRGKAASLSGENGFVLNGLGAFSRVDPFSVSVWVRTPVVPKRAVVFHRSLAALDAASRGYEMLIENGHLSLGLHHMWPGNAMKVTSKSVLPTNEWVHLVMTYDGSSRANGLKLYWNGAETQTETVRDNLWKDIIYERGTPQLTIGFRFRDNGFRDGFVDEFKVFDRALAPIEVEHLHGSTALQEALTAENLSEAQREHLFDYYLANFNPLYSKYLADLHELRGEQSKLINPIPEVMAMHEMPKPRPAFILKRGAYDAPGEPVTMNTPAAILPFKPEYPRNRLGLAKWIFDPENPLSARVAANRLWQQMFGRGIVATSDNFGSQGDLPTHPELLDWLANDLRDHNWDMKRFLKQIAMSATYRQSSRGSPESIAADPENKLLARMPAYRLSAEMLRDNALASSGLLVNKIGGAPVKPYQPEGLWEEKSGARYERDKGEALYRRSLYTFWKRTSPPPTMVSFDAAERNTCIVRRQVTSTPLQSLILLNDPQLTEASRWLAERMFKNGGSTLDSRLSYLFRLLTSRSPKLAELGVLEKIYAEQHEIFAKNEQESVKLLTVGDKANDPSIPPIDLAAGSVVASALLNYDETSIKR
jgi:mono/diheme cytochrome c family protein